MSDESTNPELTCWFCTKGLHDDCMKEKIPVNIILEADCSFSTGFEVCECYKRDHDISIIKPQ